MVTGLTAFFTGLGASTATAGALATGTIVAGVGIGATAATGGFSSKGGGSSFGSEAPPTSPEDKQESLKKVARASLISTSSQGVLGVPNKGRQQLTGGV